MPGPTDKAKRQAEYDAMLRAGDFWRPGGRPRPPAEQTALKHKVRASVNADPELNANARDLSDLWLTPEFFRYGHAYPSATTAAQRLGLERTTIYRLAALLVDRGHWCKFFKTGKSNTCIYWPNWESVAPMWPRDPDPEPATKVLHDPTLMQHDSIRQAPTANQPAQQGVSPERSDVAEAISHPAEPRETTNDPSPAFTREDSAVCPDQDDCPQGDPTVDAVDRLLTAPDLKALGQVWAVEFARARSDGWWSEMEAEIREAYQIRVRELELEERERKRRGQP
jgi:hypothetical protein